MQGGTNGRGQLYMFITFMIFILAFTIYKNTVRHDKEIKRQKEDAIRHQQKIETAETEELRKLIQELEDRKLAEYQRRQNILNRMKESNMNNVCYDLHIFAIRPEKEISKEHGTVVVLKKGKKRSLFLNTDETEEQIKARRTMISGPIAYLFVIVLLYSLVRAATEITQHFQKKAAGEGEKRRCSLQEYAGLKQYERRSSKAQFTRRSTMLAMDTRLKRFHNSFDERRNSQNQAIPEVPSISGQITVPGSPAKITNGIAIKPAPLLRRCSVPAFAMGTGNKLRRTSMDSFSEDDTSPDVKRRVRMIHRH